MTSRQSPLLKSEIIQTYFPSALSLNLTSSIQISLVICLLGTNGTKESKSWMILIGDTLYDLEISEKEIILVKSLSNNCLLYSVNLLFEFIPFMGFVKLLWQSLQYKRVFWILKVLKSFEWFERLYSTNLWSFITVETEPQLGHTREIFFV